MKLEVLLVLCYCEPRYCAFTTDMATAIKYHHLADATVLNPCDQPKLSYTEKITLKEKASYSMANNSTRGRVV